MPSDNASGRSPFEVSSPMAVVMTRVTPSILPPTIINGEYIQARIKLNPIRRNHLATSRFVVPHTAVTSAPEVLGELDRRCPVKLGGTDAMVLVFWQGGVLSLSAEMKLGEGGCQCNGHERA